MISKKILLAGIAAGAVAVATQAGAITLTATTTGNPGDDTTGGTGAGGFTVSNPYLIGQQLNFLNGVSAPAGVFKTVAAVGGVSGQGNALLTASTTYQLTITFAGAQINAAPASTDLTFVSATGAAATNTPTVTVVSGAAGGNTVTYQIATTGTQSNAAFIDIAPAIVIKGSTAGNVSMTVALIDSSGNQFSPTATGVQLITAAPTFKITVTPDTTPTYAAAPYTTLATAGADNIIGTVAFAPNTTSSVHNNIVYQGLTGVTPATNNLNSAEAAETLTITGDMSALKLAGTDGEGTLGTANTQTATQTFAPTGTSGVDTISVSLVTGTTNPIVASSYTVSGSITLNNSTFNGSTLTIPTTGSSFLQSVQRQGYSVIVPWVASGTQAAASGTMTVIRISSIHGVTGDVFAELINGSGNTNGVHYMGTLGLGGEVSFNSQDIQNAFGGVNFVRGDFRITVNTAGTAGTLSTAGTTSNQPQGIIVKRLMVRTSGVTEMLNLSETGTALDSTTTATTQNTASY